MNKTLLNIKIKYDALGKAEKRIADFILQNPAGLIPLSISELAARCGSGEATVVRFARRLGHEGYQQLKISLAREQNVSPINENISAADSAAAVFAKVCNDVYCSLEKTKSVLDTDALEKACRLLQTAGQIFIFGLGNSASVAMDAAHKLLRLGLKATAYTDSHMQAIAAAHADESCVVVGVSHSGSSRDIVDALRIAQGKGAATVAITNFGKSPIDKVSDCLLRTVADETNYTILGLSSRIAQLTIIDALYSYLACRLPGAKDAIAATETALLCKKF